MVTLSGLNVQYLFKMNVYRNYYDISLQKEGVCNFAKKARLSGSLRKIANEKIYLFSTAHANYSNNADSANFNKKQFHEQKIVDDFDENLNKPTNGLIDATELMPFDFINKRIMQKKKSLRKKTYKRKNDAMNSNAIKEPDFQDDLSKINDMENKVKPKYSLFRRCAE